MSSLAESVGAQIFSSQMHSSTYRQNVENTSQFVPLCAVAIASSKNGTRAFVFRTYHQKDVHITPGQISATMDAEGKSISMKSIWPSTSSEWVARMLMLCNCGKEDAALKEISLAIADFKAAGKLQQLADDLLGFNPMKLPDIVLIGLLRNTYSVRAHIPSWNTLLVQTEKILTGHKKNSRVLLRGLKSQS